MNDDEGIPDEESDYPDSGPFCEHWAEPWSCSEVCCQCGMRCSDHEPAEYHEFVTAGEK